MWHFSFVALVSLKLVEYCLEIGVILMDGLLMHRFFVVVPVIIAVLVMLIVTISMRIQDCATVVVMIGRIIHWLFLVGAVVVCVTNMIYECGVGVMML